MAIKSMTGYGTETYSTQDYHLSISVKSVNGRYLEVRFHSGRDYSFIESELKKQVQKLIKRGSVDIYISRRGQFSKNDLELVLRKPVVKKWKKLSQELSKSWGGNEKGLGLKDVLNLPYIYEVRDLSVVTDKEKGIFLKSFKNALLNCERERVREGQALKKEILKFLERLLQLTKKMNQIRGVTLRQIEGRLKEKLKKLQMEKGDADSRFAQEVVLLVDKMDISEELMRLSEHVKTCIGAVKKNSAQGKTLDFYSQELLREVNTIGSKSGHKEMTDLVIQAKSIIESFREQVQNIE